MDKNLAVAIFHILEFILQRTGLSQPYAQHLADNPPTDEKPMMLAAIEAATPEQQPVVDPSFHPEKQPDSLGGGSV